MTQSPPTFDEWVEYCFTQGNPDFYVEYGTPEYEATEERGTRFDLGPQVLAEYVIKLFQNPDFIADRYTDDQIGDGVHFLFGIASEYFKRLRSNEVDKDTQVEWMESVGSVYLRLFDRVCCDRGKDPDADYTDATKLDGAVYMIWDMDCIEGAIMFPSKAPNLVVPGLSVLERVLMKTRTSTCRISALHGLGHIHHYHPKRCEQIIDRFLRERKGPDWLIEYARDARTGQVL